MSISHRTLNWYGTIKTPSYTGGGHFANIPPLQTPNFVDPKPNKPPDTLLLLCYGIVIYRYRLYNCDNLKARNCTIRNFYKHWVRLQIMDFLTVGLSAFLSALSSICLMFLFYRLWILPYLTDLTESVPEKARALIAPYVDEKLLQVQVMIDDRIAEVSQSVKKSTARFQRSVNQAAEYLGMDEQLDLESEDGIEKATQKATKRYGVDIAVEAVNQLLAAFAAKQKAEPDKKSITGGTTQW